MHEGIRRGRTRWRKNEWEEVKRGERGGEGRGGKIAIII
jgi:hypothetical protein